MRIDVLGQFIVIVKLSDRACTFTDSCSDTVGSGFTAADDNNFLALYVNRIGYFPVIFLILRDKKIKGKIDAF